MNNYFGNENLEEMMKIALKMTIRESIERQKAEENPLIDFTIDDLLDCYNDYMTLYQMFGRNKYRRRADEYIQELKRRVNSND